MENVLIGLRLAKLARKKGYDIFSGNMAGFIMEKPEVINLPTQSYLQKYLRDNHKIHITITSISQESWQYHITKVGEVLGKNYSEDFYTYEEALEEGLIQSLNLID